LPGESVTDSKLQIEGKEVILTLGRDEMSASWSGTLRESKTLTLNSPGNKPWTEIWVLKCSPIWQCHFNNLPPVIAKFDEQYQPTFRPWPKESLNLTFVRPAGAKGQSITVDESRLTITPGERLMRGELWLSIRTSRGGTQEITLPSGATLQALTMNKKEHPYRLRGSKVAVTLQPGTQFLTVKWQLLEGMAIFYRVPQVKIGQAAVNTTLSVHFPRERWLLFAAGPQWGPAILFWGYLITILLGGFVLGRTPHSPLKS
jgi:hypothetical protein